MKKILSIILAVCILFSVITFASFSVFAAAKYNVDAAIEYAAKHVNDNDGSQCAEFVSKCVQAGGLNVPINTGTYSCWNAILNASGLSGENLVLNSKGYATKNDNEAMLNRGDVVVQWCYTCNLRPHILICGGYDSEGYATFYAHNSALDNKRYNFSKNSQHEASCNIGAKVVQLSKLNTADPTTVESTLAEPTSSKQKCGDNAYYNLDNNGILTISGNGEMWDYEWGMFYDKNTPIEEFTALKNSVIGIIIEEGITGIGKLAFMGFNNLKTVEIPYSVKHIGEEAFYSLENIEQFSYNGSLDDWKLITIDDTPMCNTSAKILMSLKTKDSQTSSLSSPYKTGTVYQINAIDENGQVMATANINENGFLTKIEGKDYHYSYICFQPLFNASVGFIDIDFIGAETTFEYENNKISSISSIGTLSNNDNVHTANILGQIINSYRKTYDFNNQGLCVKAQLKGPSSEEFWEYDKNNCMTRYGYVGMAPTYYYYYDETGKLKNYQKVGPGMTEEYSYEYLTKEGSNKNTNSNIQILINNKFLKCEQPPVLINGRTLVPMRTIFEALGADVSWNAQLRTATGIKDGKTVSFTIDKNAITINGNDYTLDVPAQLINDKTMIPARAVAEAFDCDVNWDQAKQYVIITPRN